MQQPSERKAIPPGSVPYYINRTLYQNIQQVFFRQDRLKLVLADRSWILFTGKELGLDAKEMMVLPNPDIVRLVVSRMIAWSKKHTKKDHLYLYTSSFKRILVSREALPFLEDEILNIEFPFQSLIDTRA